MSSVIDKIDRLIESLNDYVSITTKDAFVIVTKWPTKGKSKTRLSKGVGTDLAIDFALSALKDLLIYFSKLPHKKFLLFAPKESESRFESLFKQINLVQNEYILLPMRDSNVTTSDLGNKFSGCVQDVRSKHNINGSICFIASDCLDLRYEHISIANKYTHLAGTNNAYIIPAIDGGYVMIDLPPNASHQVFDNVLWSNKKTCESQIAAVKRCGMEMIVSNVILEDVDEMEDLLRLCTKFGIEANSNKSKKHNNDNNDEIIVYNQHFPNVSALLHKQIKNNMLWQSKEM